MYLKITAAETPFLLREPEEVKLTLEQEEAILRSSAEDPRALMLIARINGEYAGNCALLPLGNKQRIRHRCGAAIALYQKFCGLGLGRAMMETVIDTAEALGYEQIELEVVSGNNRAIHLYESLGFTAYGTRPRAMKYKDGSYADEILMVKVL